MQQFRCYAFKRNEHWYAACIDLNLVDRAETLDIVVNKLRENIQLYIQDKDVITFRRTPLFYQFQYQWILLKTLVLSWFQKQIDDFDAFLIKSMISQSGFSREEFYCATKRTARKIGRKRRR